MKRLLVSIGMVMVVAILGIGRFGGNPFEPQAVFARVGDSVDCPASHQTLRSQLIVADTADTTGLNNHYWAVVVNRAGVVCAVAFSGPSTDAQWLLSRQIAAAKAFTANGLSLDSAPLSTAQLYPWVQPGAPANPLFGLAAGNPVSPEDAYQGSLEHFGTKNDPMVGKRVGGTITFGRLRDLLGMAPASGNDRITLDNATGHPHCPNDAGTRGKN